MEVVDGSWPLHFQGLVITHTASIDCADIALLDSRDRGLFVSNSGAIRLSRRVWLQKVMLFLPLKSQASLLIHVI